MGFDCVVRESPLKPRRVPALSVGFACLVLLHLGCASDALRRFPEGRAVVWQDDDLRPFITQCRPDPEEPGHQLCSPEPYVSPFAWDAIDNSVFLPMSRALAVRPSREAINVNAVDEVPDSSWFENRIGQRQLTPEELSRGPCSDGEELDANAPDGAWLIDQGKPNGANPGFRIRSQTGGKFMLKADVAGEPERATAAAAIAARIYWAAGYFAPCDSVVYLRPSLLELKPGLQFADNSGVSRNFDAAALNKILTYAAKRDGLVRMTASRWLPGRPIGPFTYTGVREDDANDVIPHEHRRDLRGARLIAAWLNHFDSREQNSMSVWLAANASDPDSTPGYVRHYYLDLGDCFGSQWDWDGISRRLGHAYYLDFGYLTEDFVTLGLIERPWDRAKIIPGFEIFGYYSARDFAPEAWRAGYPNPAFAEMSERDGAWAARIISRFTRAHLKASVAAGNLSNPKHSSYLLDQLLGRQQAILKRYFAILSPLTDVRVAGNRLCSTDLARSAEAFQGTRFVYSARAYAGTLLEQVPALPPRATASGLCVDLPRVGRRGSSSAERYLVVDLSNGQARGPLRVHLYDQGARGFELAGVERPESIDPPQPD
jgi:hypothetical protein